AQADDKLDALGHGHVELGDFTLRHHHQKTAGRIRSGRDENADDPSVSLLERLFSGYKPYGPVAGLRKFNEHDLLERRFVRGESLIDLFDGEIDFVQQRHAQETLIEQLDHLLADIIASEPAHEAD